MRSFSNKRKNLFILLVTAKPVMLLVLLFYITGLGGWRKNTTQAVSDVRLQKNTSFVEVEMTSKRSKTENRYHPLILQAANRYKVEPAIIKAIIRAESGFNPKAVSKVGAKRSCS